MGSHLFRAFNLPGIILYNCLKLVPSDPWCHQVHVDIFIQDGCTYSEWSGGGSARARRRRTCFSEAPLPVRFFWDILPSTRRAHWLKPAILWINIPGPATNTFWRQRAQLWRARDWVRAGHRCATGAICNLVQLPAKKQHGSHLSSPDRRNCE